MPEFRKLETYDNAEEAVLAAIDTDPDVPVAAESGEAGEPQGPDGYAIGNEEDGWFFLTTLGAKSTFFSDRQAAVDAAWNHAVDLADAGNPAYDREEAERRAFRGAIRLFLNPTGQSIEFRQRRNEILIETLAAYGEGHARAVAPVDHQSFLDRLEEVAKSKDLDKLPVRYEVKFDDTRLTWDARRRAGKAGFVTIGKYGSEEDAHVAAWKDFYATNSPKNPAQRPSAPVRPLKRTVVLESPYRGKDEEGTLRNVDYARRALADCLSRGEAAFASHLLYTQIGVLDDTVADERERGIRAGYMVGNHLNTVVFYMDHGMSPGMIAALEHYTRAGLSTEFRYLDDHDL